MHSPLRLFTIIFTALVALAVMSVCPWEKWTGGRLKNFNLLGDLLPAASAPATDSAVADNLDPELAKLKDIVPSAPVDTPDAVIEIPADFKAPTIDGTVLIEDYSPDHTGLARLASTLDEGASRRVRIAMVGDSYIEGDILAQDIRASLQDMYGGCGVGYMAAFSHFPGFRHSVNQTSDNWTEHEIRKMKQDDALRTILGTCYTATPGANVRFRGSVRPAHADAWHRTSVVFIAPVNGTITFTGVDNQTDVHAVEGSSEVQCITLNSPTKDIRVSTDINGLQVLGIWLEGTYGIVLDDISLRGNSGISHRQLNAPTTASMRRYIDYDLIILEFGMNALSAAQKDYTAYGAGMVEVVNNIKALYPGAQIMILGVGDRGHKSGTALGSMPTVTAMVKAQRDVARQTGSLFWDTRAAMGGEGAAVEWHGRKLVNSDYVHLNHKGGKELADIFIKSLTTSLSR
ncbi:MAG: hypothetical protein JFR41_02280 [Muribaculaceae bacterium]|nr:hypothetical protein [Muribaculaceae bacterium]